MFPFPFLSCEIFWCDKLYLTKPSHLHILSKIPWGPVYGINQMNSFLFQNWEQRLKLLNRWAAAVEAAHRIQRAHLGVKMKAPAARGKSQHMFPLPSHHTSSTTTGMLLLMAPAGHKEAISSWTRSVSKCLCLTTGKADYDHSAW